MLSCSTFVPSGVFSVGSRGPATPVDTSPATPGPQLFFGKFYVNSRKLRHLPGPATPGPQDGIGVRDPGTPNGKTPLPLSSRSQSLLGQTSRAALY